MRLFLCSALPLLLAVGCVLNAEEQDDPVKSAVELLQRGDLGAAEQTLRAELKTKPNDGAALGMLGVVLDQEKKYTDADEAYRKALQVSPRSPALLNNYGNHLFAMGKLREARAAYLEVLALDPGHANAALQVAQIAMQRNAPAEALKYLQTVPPSVVAKDPRLSVAMGVALAAAGKYERAETFLDKAVQAAPADFQARYYLGLAASHAGHDERAREVLQKALELQPENPGALYDLAAVDARLNQKEVALELLARAARIAPERTDVLFLLAHTAADLGYFGDAAQTWERYLKLKPDDDTARREHAFVETALGEDMQSGLAELQAYVQKHPGDAAGHYELGTAETTSDQDEALKELDRALALKPDLTAAHVARGLLRYRQGKPEAALQDFQYAAARDPENAGILDRLGQVYMILGRTADGLPVLRKAADLAPRDSTILLHYARALSKAGRREEASAVFARCRELGPGKSALPHRAGLVDFMSLSPEEQGARYRAGVERTVQKDPANVEAQVHYLELLLEDGKIEEALALVQKIPALNPSLALIEETARALLAGEQFAAAKEFLEHSGQGDSSSELRLDMAIADSHVVSTQAGLAEMDAIPHAQRGGDYYLALSTMLEAAGRASDSTAALKRAIQAHPTRPDLYRDAAALLIKDHRPLEAQQLLDEGTRALPEDTELTLMRDALKTSTSN